MIENMQWRIYLRNKHEIIIDCKGFCDPQSNKKSKTNCGVGEYQKNHRNRHKLISIIIRRRISHDSLSLGL